jgi:hypothetical protein
VERIVIHPVRSEAAKPFARAEFITTGKGLLDRAGYAECYTGPETYWLDLEVLTGFGLVYEFGHVFAKLIRSL